jgi:hypothetical protein
MLTQFMARDSNYECYIFITIVHNVRIFMWLSALSNECQNDGQQYIQKALLGGVP